LFQVAVCLSEDMREVGYCYPQKNRLIQTLKRVAMCSPEMAQLTNFP